MASVITWHSIRIGLACALKQANCPDDIIQLICRWTSASSLRTYARMGVSANVQWCDAAEQAVVTAVQVSNLPRLDNSQEYSELLTSNLRGLDLGNEPQAARPAQRRATSLTPQRATPATPVVATMLAPIPRPRSELFRAGTTS